MSTIHDLSGEYYYYYYYYYKFGYFMDPFHTRTELVASGLFKRTKIIYLKCQATTIPTYFFFFCIELTPCVLYQDGWSVIIVSCIMVQICLLLFSQWVEKRCMVIRYAKCQIALSYKSLWNELFGAKRVFSAYEKCNTFLPNVNICQSKTAAYKTRWHIIAFPVTCEFYLVIIGGLHGWVNESASEHTDMCVLHKYIFVGSESIT